MLNQYFVESIKNTFVGYKINKNYKQLIVKSYEFHSFNFAKHVEMNFTLRVNYLIHFILYNILINEILIKLCHVCVH